jgi:hypothetical protein
MRHLDNGYREVTNHAHAQARASLSAKVMLSMILCRATLVLLYIYLREMMRQATQVTDLSRAHGLTESRAFARHMD